MNKISNPLSNNAFVMILSIALGIVAGLGIRYYVIDNYSLVAFFVLSKHIINQLIRFLIPFIVFGIITSSIISFQKKGMKMIVIISIFGIAYLSSFLAGLFGLTIGYIVLPNINLNLGQIAPSTLPVFDYQIPILDTRIAVVLAIFCGLVSSWLNNSNASLIAKYATLISFFMIKKILIPILPTFIFFNLVIISFDNKYGLIMKVLPILLIIVMCHIFWILFTYITTTVITRNSSWKLLRAIKRSIVSAFGSMSSTATMPIVISDLNKHYGETKRSIEVSIPLLTSIHFAGSMISEVLLVFIAFSMYSGMTPGFGNMINFIFMLSFIAIGASGMPGGINMAAAGLFFDVVLGNVNMEIFAIMTALYAIQDGIGTSCNVICNSALADLVNKLIDRKPILGRPVLNF